MELRRLSQFVAVVEEGSLTRAAERLFMAQSTLSVSLRALEHELGADLFVRGRRGVVLTDAGRALLEPARLVKRQVDRARAAVVNSLRHLAPLRLAVTVTPDGFGVEAAVDQVRGRFPDAEIALIHHDLGDLSPLVSRHETDIAITPLRRPLPDDVRYRVLRVSPVVLICPSTSALAGRRGVDPRELANEVLIDLPDDSPVRQAFDAVLPDNGAPRRDLLRATTWFGVINLVRRGVGTSYAAKVRLGAETSGIGVATLSGAPSVEFGLVTRDDVVGSTIGHAFLDSFIPDGVLT